MIFYFFCIQVKSSLKTRCQMGKENRCLTIQVQLNQRTDIPKNAKLNFLFFLPFYHRRRKMIDLKKDVIPVLRRQKACS
ncbi:hypothetical protein DVB85_28430 [Klebsiella oxytoca]|nr:hypothetical protein DVB85_28430 [Klebsiella oxytoca]TYG21776.1 hypothetical protein DJ549_26980 [Klebsiella grimontii]